MSFKDMKDGQHFWALMSGQLVMCMIDHDRHVFVCGGWECHVEDRQIEVLELVDMPEGFEAKEMYYLETADG